MFRKVKLYKSYKKDIDKVINGLSENFNMRVDKSYRLYTVLNIPKEFIGEEYSLKKSDIDRISENYIREYLLEVAKFLDNAGLKELYKVYDIKKVDKYSYLVIIGFSLFVSNIYRRNLILGGYISVLLILITILLYSLI
jgi:hypothetical protein